MNVTTSQIEMPSIQPQNPHFTTENLVKEVSSEPGMFENMKSTRIPENLGRLKSPDYMESKHGPQGLKPSRIS
jgi:hypothetical protein